MQDKGRRQEMARRAVAALLVTVVFTGGCVPIQPPSGTVPPQASLAAEELPRSSIADVPLVTIQVSADGVSLPDELPSGPVAFTVVGAGPEESLDVFQLMEGATLDQLNEALGMMEEAGPGPALALVQTVSISGEPERETIVDLQPGPNYVMRLDSPTGPVIVPVTVSEERGAADPEAAVRVEYLDFAFSLPDSVPAGPQLWEVDNVAGQWHMMLIVQLNEGVTVEEMLEFMSDEEASGPPPGEFVAAFDPISQGTRMWAQVDLAPGEYTLICPLPDLAGEMMPHAALGMVRTLTVTEP